MKKLSQPKHDLLRLWVLGGIDAIGIHSTRTVGALIKSKHIDQSGPTIKGRQYVDYHESKSFTQE